MDPAMPNGRCRMHGGRRRWQHARRVSRLADRDVLVNDINRLPSTAADAIEREQSVRVGRHHPNAGIGKAAASTELTCKSEAGRSPLRLRSKRLRSIPAFSTNFMLSRCEAAS
jgi:hypothetical protein